MKIFVNKKLRHVSYISAGHVQEKYFNYRYVRSNNLAKKMYRGSIVEEKDGMLKIETPANCSYHVPISGYYDVNGFVFKLDRKDIIEIQGVRPYIYRIG